MAIKRYVASADNTITNAYMSNLRTRGTGSNIGSSDILEVFHIYGQATSTTSENARILIKFPITDISSDRTNSTIPASGSVDFILRLYNAKHSQTLPRDFKLVISPVASDWEEGTGLDMEEYSDLTYDEIGSNWINRVGSTAWSNEGGDYISATDGARDAPSSYTASFPDGDEDMELNITTLVEQWINSAGNVLGNKSNYGVGVYLKSSEEGASRSFYTKKFFGRGTEFFFKRPVIEARWDSTRKDDRDNFLFSSSLAPASDNLNTLYLYNVVRGQLQNIPAAGNHHQNRILVSLYSGSTSNTTDPTSTKLKLSVGGNVVTAGDVNVTGGFVWGSTGVYSASFAFTGSSTLTKIFDVWHSGGVEFHTGSFNPQTLSASVVSSNPTFISSITNLKSEYSIKENSARFRVFFREHDWQPTMYTVASTDAENKIIDDAYYRVFRVTDNLEVVPYATGTSATPQAVGNNESYTRLSYDADGNYFDFDIKLLEPGYSYGIQMAYYFNGDFREQLDVFKFRVE
ncbi:hypothetical protein CL634_01470 [bacterium]|nr:hypothetical protein [bacterium]